MDGSILAGVAVSDPKRLDDVLIHYGIKGMKWGVRRANPSASATPASDDAKAQSATKAQIKSSGTKSLSNQELKTYLERMDLEARYNKANPTKTAQAKKAVKDLLLQVGKQELGKAIAKEVAKKLTRTG